VELVQCGDWTLEDPLVFQSGEPDCFAVAVLDLPSLVQPLVQPLVLLPWYPLLNQLQCIPLQLPA
jgi:hypothetical protein